MNEILSVVAKAQREKTPFCERFIEFLQAGLDQATIDAVNYNIVAWQESEGVLKTDREFEYYNPNAKKPMSGERFKGNEANIMQNKSDAKVLGELAEYKAEYSLDMGEVVQGWFDYVRTGQRGFGMTAAEDEAAMEEFGF